MEHGNLCLSRTTNPDQNRIVYEVTAASGEVIRFEQSVISMIGSQVRVLIKAPQNVKVLRGELA